MFLSQHLFDDACLVVAAIQNGKVRPRQALLEAGRLDALDHGFGFVLIVVAGQHLQRIALAQG